MTKLLLFGNPAIPSDSLAVKVGKELEKEGYETLHLEDPLGLLDLDLSEYLILDVARGLDEPRIVDDPDKLLLGRLCSLHDFDMAYFLKLLKATGRIEKVRIIALPEGLEVEDAVRRVKEIVARRTSQLMD